MKEAPERTGMYDLLVKGGLLIDPAQGISEQRDIAVEAGRVAAVESRLPESSAKRVIDAGGLIVTPGLIDLHTHVAHDVVRLSVDPDQAGLLRGTTTVVDAGSTGELVFRPFYRYVIRQARSRVLAYLNIESLGMVEFADLHPYYTDQRWPDLLMAHDEALAHLFVNIEATLRTLREHSDVLVGLKWAHHGLRVLGMARRAADQAGVQLMAENHYQPELLDYLKPGDVVTHIYHFFYNRHLGRHDGISEDGRTIIPEIFDAVKRGVVLDVGHGKGSFSWTVAELALKEGLKPHTISTDLWVGNLHGPVYDLPTTMAKFLHLGMSIEEVIKATTMTPAQVLGRLGEIGTLKPGASADIVAFKLEEGRFPLLDSYGEGRMGRRRLTPIHVVKSGEPVVSGP